MENVTLTEDQLTAKLTEKKTEGIEQGKQEATKSFEEKMNTLEQEIKQLKVEEKRKTSPFSDVRVVENEKSFPLGALLFAKANQKFSGVPAEQYLKDLSEKGNVSAQQALMAGYKSAMSMGDTGTANQYATQSKAMGVGDIASGGGLLMPGAETEFIDVLRAGSIVRESGVQVIPATNGKFFYNKATGSITAYRKGENQALTASDMTLGQVEGSVKKLTSLTYIANELLRSGDPANFRIIEQNAISSLNEKDALDLLVGDGNEHTPKGIFNYESGTASGGTTASLIGKDLKNAVSRLATRNVIMDGWAWAMHPTLYYIIIDQRDANGQTTNYARRLEEQNVLFGQPVYQSTHCPTDKIALYRVRDFAIGQAYGLTVDMSADVAFANDQTALRVVMADDLVAKRTEGVTVIKSISWT